MWCTVQQILHLHGALGIFGSWFWCTAYEYHLVSCHWVCVNGRLNECGILQMWHSICTPSPPPYCLPPPPPPPHPPNFPPAHSLVICGWILTIQLPSFFFIYSMKLHMHEKVTNDTTLYHTGNCCKMKATTWFTGLQLVLSIWLQLVMECDRIWLQVFVLF